MTEPEKTEPVLQEAPGISDGPRLFLFTVAIPSGAWLWWKFFEWLLF